MQRSDESGAGGGVDWDEVRRLYEAREVPVGAIRARFKITAYQLMKARLQGGWETRPQVATPGANQGRGGGVLAQSLKRRILRVVDALLREHEKAAARGEPVRLTAQQLTLLTAMAKVADGAIDADTTRRGGAPAAPRRANQNRKAVGGGFATAEEARAADVAFMRAELKRQVAFLRRNAGLEGGARPPDGR